jgi:hypothetical protein
MHAIYLILLSTVFITLSGCGGGGSTSTSSIDTYRFTGTAHIVAGIPPGGITEGTAVTGTFSVDRNSIGNTNSGTPNITTYPQTSLAAVNIGIGGMTFNSTINSYVVTIGDNVTSRNFNGDQFSWDAIDPTLATTNSLTSVTAHFALADSTGLSFVNTALPTTLAVDQFDARALLITGTGGSVVWQVMSIIDSITKIN